MFFFKLLNLFVESFHFLFPFFFIFSKVLIQIGHQVSHSKPIVILLQVFARIVSLGTFLVY